MKHKKYTAPSKLRSQIKRKRQDSVQKKPVLEKAIQEALIQFREYHPVSRLSRNLRTLLIEFLMYDGAIEADYLQDLLYDLQGLFELLETIQVESERERNPES
jgi:hypothetical protein